MMLKNKGKNIPQHTFAPCIVKEVEAISREFALLAVWTTL
jgi:hypothetical protein